MDTRQVQAKELKARDHVLYGKHSTSLWVTRTSKSAVASTGQLAVDVTDGPRDAPYTRRATILLDADQPVTVVT